LEYLPPPLLLLLENLLLRSGDYYPEGLDVELYHLIDLTVALVFSKTERYFLIQYVLQLLTSYHLYSNSNIHPKLVSSPNSISPTPSTTFLKRRAPSFHQQEQFRLR